MIEPFDPLVHDTTTFCSGLSNADAWIKSPGLTEHHSDIVRIWSAIDDAARVIGFYAIRFHSVLLPDAEGEISAARESPEVIPGALISMLCVDRLSSGGGLGLALVTDALRRIAKAGATTGIGVALIDIVDCGDSDAVASWRSDCIALGFRPLTQQPTRLYLPVATVLRGLG